MNEPETLIATHVEGDHSVRKHASCSPSKLKTYAICPSYIEDPDKEVHVNTERGTAMHEAMETGNDAGLSDEERGWVQMCRDATAELFAGAEHVIIEPRLETGHPDVYGYADVILIMPKDANGRRKAVVLDWKFGAHLVAHPSQNPQAFAYTIAVFLAWPDVDEVDFAFLHPRHGEEGILQHTFTRAELPELRLTVYNIADRKRDLAGKEFNPDALNCLYCQKSHCPVMRQRALSIGHRYADDTSLLPPEKAHSSEIMDPEDMARALNLAHVIEGWAKSVKANALRYRKELGQEIPGWRLVHKKGVRSVNSTEGLARLAFEYGVTQEEFLTACKASLPSVITLVRSHAEKDKKGVEQKFTDKAVDDTLISFGESFDVLVREKAKKDDAIDVESSSA